MFRRKRKASNFSAEIEAHLQMETERLQELGLNEQDARAAARRVFGNLMQAEELFYESGRWLWWDHLLQDVRVGLRMLAKSPGFTAMAVITLALAIGANTAIFSAGYALLLKPMPFRDSDRLVFIASQNPTRGWDRNNISPPQILAWRSESGAFDDLAAFSSSSCVVTGSGETEEDSCEIASSNLFPVLGVAPFRGRIFSVDEDKAETARVAILSYGFWQRRFGADETVIGRSITLNGASHTIIGVMPADFSHLYASPYGSVPEMWVSGIGLSPEHVWNDYWGIGRLKPGVRAPQASKQMDIVSARLEQLHPDLKGWRAQLVSLRTNASGDTRPALVILMGAVTFVLLIACANIANLLLTRGASRTNEFAVRNVLGASRGRIVRQLLTESLMMSIAGGIFGILLGSLGCKGLAAMAPPFVLKSAPGLASGAADSRVLAFAFVTVIVTTLFFGLGPALQSARPHVAQTLNQTARGSLENPMSLRFRSALVVSEIALAMVLLIGAGLMVRTLAQLGHVNLGVNPANVLTLRVPFAGERYKQPQARVDFWARVAAAVKGLPEVEAASVSRGVPLGDWAGQSFVTAEQPNPPAGQVPTANYVIAGPDYFRTTQISLRRGRGFSEYDTQSATQVAIVNEELARFYWPAQDPLGKLLRVGPPSAPWRSIVGIAGNVLTRGPDAGVQPEIYIPYQQFPWLLGGPQHLLVRVSASVNPANMFRAVVEEIHLADGDLPVTDIATMEEIAREPMTQQRMVMTLLVCFASLALVLSALGIYGVVSYSMGQRTREIGLRMALGAQRASVLGLAVGNGLRLTLFGISAGIAAASALTRLMKDLLYGVRPTDPVTFAAVIVALGTTSMLACYIPARRAMKVDPIVALRHE